MPFHAEKPYYVHRMKEANRLLSFAMRRNPSEYYDFIERPLIGDLAEQAGNVTAAEFSHVFNAESEAIDLLKAGVQDIIPPFLTIVEAIPELQESQARAIMVHDITVATYGLLASMSQEGMSELYTHVSSYVQLSDMQDAITLVRPVTSSHEFGCEAVDTRTGRVDMTPLFKKFVPWAGSLAVSSYYKNRS